MDFMKTSTKIFKRTIGHDESFYSDYVILFSDFTLKFKPSGRIFVVKYSAISNNFKEP